jgi:hypothetical protein
MWFNSQMWTRTYWQAIWNFIGMQLFMTENRRMKGSQPKIWLKKSVHRRSSSSVGFVGWWRVLWLGELASQGVDVKRVDTRARLTL